MNFNDNLSAKLKITPFIQNRPDKVIYTQSKSYKFKESVFNPLKKSDIQYVIYELRAGGMGFNIFFVVTLVAAVTYMIYINRVQGFQ